jgi:hypothetical protein
MGGAKAPLKLTTGCGEARSSCPLPNSKISFPIRRGVGLGAWAFGKKDGAPVAVAYDDMVAEAPGPAIFVIP